MWFEEKKQKKLEDYVVVHFRGGDLMRKNPNSGYWQPPCSYYIINNSIKQSKKQKILNTK
jgi:hypothetical protein